MKVFTWIFLVFYLSCPLVAQRAEDVLIIGPDTAPYDSFGHGVGLDGEVMAIGAPWDDDLGNKSGSVYVYRNTAGTHDWVFEQKLVAADGADFDSTGMFTYVHGDLIGAGSRGNSVWGPSSGAAYVFRYNPSAGAWEEEAKLVAPDGAAGDHFGVSIIMGQEVALVGAYKNGELGFEAGAAYVYGYDALSQGWHFQQKLLASDGTTDDRFGRYNALNGDVALIGALRDDDNGIDAGAGYVFRRNPGTGEWEEEAKILASDGAARDHFGVTNAIRGDLAVVGAIWDDTAYQDAGSAYVFRRNPANGAWEEEAKLVASDADNEAYFGGYVEILTDEVIAVGAYGDDYQGELAGAVYLFEYDSGSGEWRELNKLVGAQGASGDVHGRFFGSTGDIVAVGARRSDLAATDAGAVCVYHSVLLHLDVDPLPLSSSGNATFQVRGGKPQEPTYLVFSLTKVGMFAVPALDLTIDLNQPQLAADPLPADASGTVEWTLSMGSIGPAPFIAFQALQDQGKSNVVVTKVL